MPAVSNPVVRLEDYRDKYRDAELRREDGILEVRFGTGGAPTSRCARPRRSSRIRT